MSSQPPGTPTAPPQLPQEALDRLHRGQAGFFTSDLSVDEYLLVKAAGFHPLGLVVGSSIYHIGAQIGNFNQNMELAYLTQAMPMLVVWGTEDKVIPVKHAETVAAIAPGAQVEVLGNSGHFPHKDHPERFVKILNDFVRSTQPASYHRGRWRQLLRNGPLAPVTEQLHLAHAVPIA